MTEPLPPQGPQFLGVENQEQDCRPVAELPEQRQELEEK